MGERTSLASWTSKGDLSSKWGPGLRRASGASDAIDAIDCAGADLLSRKQCPIIDWSSLHQKAVMCVASYIEPIC